MRGVRPSSVGGRDRVDGDAGGGLPLSSPSQRASTPPSLPPRSVAARSSPCSPGTGMGYRLFIERRLSEVDRKRMKALKRFVLSSGILTAYRVSILESAFLSKLKTLVSKAHLPVVLSYGVEDGGGK